jgi:formate C-acetyltransferase
MNGRNQHGIVAAALSVSKLPFDCAGDGITLTATLTPAGLGRTRAEQVNNLVGALDGYIGSSGFVMNVNVPPRHAPRGYGASRQVPQLTIRVSGYAVNFVRLTPEQQHDVINRTFHGNL